MTLEDYSKQAISTLTTDHEYGEFSPQLLAQVLGLAGESGEFADKIKKIIRDNHGNISKEARVELLKELGDVLWYVNALSTLLGSDLESVAKNNLEKILSRKARGVTKGSGDNR
jgi:NTP pyrophosphatase (non-canonical NTP hydrolase)